MIVLAVESIVFHVNFFKVLRCVEHNRSKWTEVHSPDGWQNSAVYLVTCSVKGLPVGFGEPFFNSVESAISHAVFSIPAIKGIEFGSGFAAAQMKGSEHNDAIIDEQGSTRTNNAGGINGTKSQSTRGCNSK